MSNALSTFSKKYWPDCEGGWYVFIVYADLECLLNKQQSCQNNPISYA